MGGFQYRETAAAVISSELTLFTIFRFVISFLRARAISLFGWLAVSLTPAGRCDGCSDDDTERVEIVFSARMFESRVRDTTSLGFLEGLTSFLPRFFPVAAWARMRFLVGRSMQDWSMNWKPVVPIVLICDRR